MIKKALGSFGRSVGEANKVLSFGGFNNIPNAEWNACQNNK